MRTFVALLAVFLLLGAGALAFIYSGLFNVAATDPHWGMTRWAMETARTYSIRKHAVGITPPPTLNDPDRTPIGLEHFAAHCAVCHGAPGVPKGDIGKGLYPQAPDLAQISETYTPAELFWVIKHGIKMTGMPAWADHDDEEIWATVAFLKKLKGMSEADYAKLIMSNMGHDGGHPMHGPQPGEKREHRMPHDAAPPQEHGKQPE